MSNENVNALAKQYAEAVAAHAAARNACAVATYNEHRAAKAAAAAREALLDAAVELLPPVGPAVFAEVAS